MTAATVAAPAYSVRFGNKLPNVALTPQTFSHLWLTAETDEADDAVELGYLPAGVIVIGVIIANGEIDSHGTPTLTQNVLIGSTTVVTETTVSNSAGGAAFYFTPLALTAPALVKVVTVGTAATHANATQYLTFLYHSGA